MVYFFGNYSCKKLSRSRGRGYMTIREAREIEERFCRMDNPSEEDEFLFTEALNLLICEENRPEDMMKLGGFYYEQRQFELARKYYEMASASGIDAADECLGYIWYYGRTGERDYEKAYRHYSRSMARGNPVSAYKIADMYKNGYFVEKDEEKFREILEDLYPKVKDARFLNEPLPEVFTRLARIRRKQGDTEATLNLYLRAKDFLAQRIRFNSFFGNLSIMKGLIDELYELIEFDLDSMDYYDLYHVLKEPVRVWFQWHGRRLEVEVHEEDGICAFRFGEKWYRDRDAFFRNARIADRRLTSVYNELTGF